MHPVLVMLPGGFPVHSYGVLLGVSIFVGWFISSWFAENRDGFPASLTGGLYIVTIGSALVGARLLYVLTNLERFDSIGQLFKLNQGGLVAYGGFLGGYVGSAIYCRVHKLSILAWADAAVPCLGSGLFFTRIGCLLYGCDYGQPWNGPLAITFPPGSPCYNEQRVSGLLPEHALRSLPVHPTQLYESAVGLLLLGLCLLVWQRRKRRGEVFIAFTMGYGVLRFLLELLRGDNQRGALFGFSTSQIIAITTFGIAAILWITLRRAPMAAAVANPLHTRAAGRRKGKHGR
jgi:phosphatidylglycerol:prolipoprotein diacylglycerol transferase